MTPALSCPLALAAVLAAGCAHGADPPLPLPSGHYVFAHRYAEHPTLASMTLEVSLHGTHIVVRNRVARAPFPAGVLAEGQLMWHTASGQWIIGDSPADRHAPEVGGCSTGPDVVDLLRRIYWTC